MMVDTANDYCSCCEYDWAPFQTPVLTSGEIVYKYKKIQIQILVMNMIEDQPRPLSSHPAGPFANTYTKNTNTNTGRAVNTIEDQPRPLSSHPAGPFTNTNTKNTNTNTGRAVNTIEDQSRPLSLHPAGSFTKQTLADNLTVAMDKCLKRTDYTDRNIFKRGQRKTASTEMITTKEWRWANLSVNTLVTVF